MTEKPRAVCVDLGGVVVRICRSWEEACARAGVRAPDAQRFHDETLAVRRRQLVDLYQTGRIDCAAFWSGLAEATGRAHTPREVRMVHEAWTMEDYPGVRELIDDLNSAGRITACLSNTNHAHWEILRGAAAPAPASPAIARLRTHMVSHKLGAAKPDERIYQLAESTLGLPADAIVFFDDLEENVHAAARRGWSAHLIDHTGDTAAQMRAHLQRLGVL
ncbi:MAG: HAD family phosphatase [Planctomycetota bacterium]|nr:HAD family phosphatase [Planctomycetota bacterium]